MSEIKKEKTNNVRSGWARAGIVTAWCVGGLLLLIILLLTAATWWLTPTRLTELVNREASENLYADVKAHNIRFTLWSSWPHLRLEMDSISIRSRVFDSIPDSLSRKLPKDASFLASSGHFSGGINLLSLIWGGISLRDVEAGSLRLNLVALNDSLSNFNIIPPDTVKSRIPRFTANNVRFLNTGSIRYRSIPDSADASVMISALSLTRKDKENLPAKDKPKKHSHEDYYSLRILGKVDANVSGLTVLNGFPFELDGIMALGFDPFRVSTSDYRVNLGMVKSNLDMKMQVGGNSSLDAFKWHLDNFDLMRVLAYIPGISLPALDTFRAPLTVNATARLTSPWRLSSTVLPSAEVDFEVVDGDMSYTLADGSVCTLRHEGAGGHLLFDGVDPKASSFIIPPFHIIGDGVDLTLGAGMTSLLGNPEVEATLEGNAALKPLAKVFPFLREYKLDGDLSTLATLSAHLLPLSQLGGSGSITDLDLNGNITLHDFSGVFENSRLRASGKNLELKMGGDTDSTSFPQFIAFSAKGEGLRLTMPASDTHLLLKDIDLTGKMDAALVAPINFQAPKTDKAMIMDVKSSGITLHSGADRMDLSRISLDFSAAREKRANLAKTFRMPERWLADTASFSFARHSDPFLHISLPEKVKNIMAQWRPALRLKIGEGVISTPSFPARNTLRGIDLYASFDTILLRSLNFRSRSSALTMHGKVTNLRQFLTSPVPAPLYLDMDVAMDTMQINQLAGTYLRGKGRESRDEKDDSCDNTVATLLPRNLVADIRATARRTDYTNLHLYDLATGVHLRDGDLNVEDMRISADFGHAYLNFGFLTSDIQRIGMRADLGLLDLNVVGFFKKFHSLLMMMPQMKNLDGEISAEANMNLLIFPNMYVNIPSINADIRMQGDGLTVHQSSFIRRITRMLLIRENGPLHIADMNVHASIHDNLLELYPFNFVLDRYRLRMGGLNNFNGDLYYHIGVEKSPIPFPFGVNIIGNISDPKIRFGGAHWKIRKGEEVSASVMEEHRINVIKEGKKFLKEFLRKAAESDK